LTYILYLWPIGPFSLMQCFYRPPMYCYDTVTLNPNNQTELHGIAVALLCDELTV